MINGALLRKYSHRYAQAGFGVIPLRENDKVPDPKYAPNGLKNATTDTMLIEDWVVRGWVGNIGILPPVGYVVIDVDGDQGVIEMQKLQELHGRLPTTRTQRTGTGWHRLYQHDGPPLAMSKKRLGCSHVDLRGEGQSYIVAAPSIHPNGSEYRWMTGRDTIATLPPAYCELLAHAEPQLIGTGQLRERGADEGDGSPYGVAALAQECQSIRASQPGNRNHQLNASAFAIGQLVAGGELNHAAAYNQLAMAAYDIGLSDPEVGKTLHSGFAAGREAPRSGESQPIILLNWEKR
jgi:hypothetical protein